MVDDSRRRASEQRLVRLRRRDREKRQRRQEILEAARAVFSRNGYSSTRMDDVATEAEVSKGTVYLYFKSKEVLLAHLLLEGLDMLLMALEDEAAMDEPPSAVEHIRNLAQIYVGLSETHPDYLRLMMAFDCGPLAEAIPLELNRQILDRSTRCLKVLERAVILGNEHREWQVEDPWEIAGILWASFTGVIMMMAHPVSPQVLAIGKEKMFNDAIDLLLQSLQAGRA